MRFFYFVEILNANGDLQSRHKCSELPIHLGRAYANDVILDDHHIAAEHAIIESDLDGKLIVRDLGSQNGIKHKGKRVSQLQLDGNTLAQLGHTYIRVRDSSYQVAAEQHDIAAQRWQGWPQSLSAVLIICALSLSESWLNDISDSKATDYILGVIPWLVLAAIWSSVWALANRVFDRTANFSRHVFTLSCGLAALQITDYINRMLGFSLSWEGPGLYKVHSLIAIAAITVYFHLKMINGRRRKLFGRICILGALTISGLQLAHNYQTTNRFADELYVTDMLPPSMRISRNLTLDEFDQAVSRIKTEVDTEREKSLKEKEETLVQH